MPIPAEAPVISVTRSVTIFLPADNYHPDARYALCGIQAACKGFRTPVSRQPDIISGAAQDTTNPLQCGTCHIKKFSCADRQKGLGPEGCGIHEKT